MLGFPKNSSSSPSRSVALPVLPHFHNIPPECHLHSLPRAIVRRWQSENKQSARHSSAYWRNVSAEREAGEYLVRNSKNLTYAPVTLSSLCDNPNPINDRLITDFQTNALNPKELSSTAELGFGKLKSIICK